MKKLTGAAKRILGGLQNRLSKQAKFGQSKHEAKRAAKAEYMKVHKDLKGYNPAKVDGIFSIGTMETYRAAMEPFAQWLADHGVKNAAQIERGQVISYLQERQSSGCSPWTTSRDLSAINKALGLDINKREAGLSSRRKSDITRSRLETANDKRDFSADTRQMTIAKACGCRRASVTRITPNDCQRNAQGQVVGIRLVEKGGKERVAPVLNAYKAEVTKIVDSAPDKTKPIFDRYNCHIDNHRFRAEYCSSLMAQLEQEQQAGLPWFGGDLDPGNYIYLSERDAAVGDTYHGHPTEVVAAVSGAMGHNRLEVIFSHYNYT